MRSVNDSASINEMGANETDILHEIMLRLSPGVVLFRNQRGYDERAKAHYGVGPNGGSDLIGYWKITVTPEMVGKQIAVFVALEVKTETGKVTPEQQAFVERVSADGGRAGIVRSVIDAFNVLWRGH